MDPNSIDLICSYAPKYKLLDWIDPTKLDIKGLCQNTHPAAMEMIEEYLDNNDLDKTCWCYLSSNPSAEYILRRNPDKINWNAASENTSILDLLLENIDEINWEYFAEYQTNAQDFLKKNIDIVRHIPEFYSNPSMIDIIENMINKPETFDMIDWEALSRNTAALPLLERYPDHIDYVGYTSNKAVISNEILMDKMVAEHYDEIDWNHILNFMTKRQLIKYADEYDSNDICWNPNAIDILEENPDKIVWRGLSANPAIFCNTGDDLKNKLLPILSIKYESKYKLLDWIDPSKLDWHGLCQNKHPAAIEMLEKHPDKIY